MPIVERLAKGVSGWSVGACLACAAACAAAVPLTPRDDSEVVERLVAPRSAQKPVAVRTPEQAVQQARQWLGEARAEGDPRLAGRALAALKPWAADPAAPADVVLILATVEQYLHDFEGAAKRLEGLVARDPAQPQAWLTLATLRRVQGRYDASDAACKPLQAQAALHAAACLAENAALRGRYDEARRQLSLLLARPLDAGTRTWLATTLAETEERAGRADAADQAFRAALAATPDDAYGALAYADFLIDQGRPRDALAVLARQVRSDAVLLRLAQAGKAAGAPEAERDAAELRDRFAQAALRPGDSGGHAREQSMYWWQVQSDLPRAVALARENVRTQREPLDVLLLARVAKAAADGAGLSEASRLAKEMDLHDRRLDALL